VGGAQTSQWGITWKKALQNVFDNLQERWV